MTVVVVGAGLGGLRTCESLRRLGYADDIVLIGEETHAPYSRPPLSKDVLRGGDPEVARLGSLDDLAKLGIDLRLGVEASRLDLADRQIHARSGETFEFDDLVLATGARARPLPGIGSSGVLTLRGIDDCLALRGELAQGSSVLIVGAGFIGLEVAATATQLGCDVTVVDVLAAPLERVLDPQIGAAIRRLHESAGVRFMFGVGVVGIDSIERTSTVSLTDGTVATAATVVAGIGAIPATEWLADSGLDVDNGVMCEPSLKAAEHVWAVGDIARWTPPGHGTPVRVEHWTNATDQAAHVAQNIADGTNHPFETVPYVWSDQFGAKIQTMGFTTRGDETRVVSGSLDEQSWTALIRSGDTLGGVVGMRAARNVMRSRALLASGASWNDALAAYST